MYTSTGFPLTMASGDIFPQVTSVNHSFRDVNRLMTEGRAISMACEAIEGRENPLKVQQFVRVILKNQPKDTIEDLLTWYAMGKIVGHSLPVPEVLEEETEDKERGLFLATAWAWMIWASGGPIQKTQAELNAFDLKEEGNSVLNHLALSNWAYAVRSLLKADRTEAKRRYRRALEVGGFGTDTNPPIVWTYAATFFQGLT